jgi:hypothetical protein
LRQLRLQLADAPLELFDFRPVAVKVLTSVKLDQDILAEMFKWETVALGELRHPKIVELIDPGTDDSTGQARQQQCTTGTSPAPRPSVTLRAQ